MPQMAPLNWLILLFYFTLIFYFLNLLNFFSIIYSVKSLPVTLKKKIYNWKW